MAAQQGAEVGAEVVAGSFEVSNNVRCRLTESHPYLYLGAKIFPEKVKFFAPILGRFLFVCFLFLFFRFFVLLLLLFVCLFLFVVVVVVLGGSTGACYEKIVGLRTSNFGAEIFQIVFQQWRHQF